MFTVLFLTTPAFELIVLIQANLLKGWDLKGDLVCKILGRTNGEWRGLIIQMRSWARHVCDSAKYQKSHTRGHLTCARLQMLSLLHASKLLACCSLLSSFSHQWPAPCQWIQGSLVKPYSSHWLLEWLSPDLLTPPLSVLSVPLLSVTSSEFSKYIICCMLCLLFSFLWQYSAR